MKAIVQDGFGSADALHLQEIEKPVVTDEVVLVRIRAASVNALDWHTVHGGRLVRMIAAVMRAPASPVRGAGPRESGDQRRVAGLTEAVVSIRPIRD